MLQSNTHASSFKLQPAPRPKSKRRPQNALPVSASTPSDAGSVRSCFEDDDGSEDEAALTPKASLFNVPLVSPKPASPTVVAPGTRRHRSSTLSTSARPTSSVHRLLNAMSIPLSPSTRPLSTASSPSGTVSIMLTSKSPTPSSPLFPRRTLMRSLSSTCINTSSRSSPTSPPSNLRKRMGWRGFSSAARADELSILLSPGSPLTPRRAEQLHTPTQASIDSLLHLSHHPEEADELEPLSATLKALGAKRKTHRFRETSSPPSSAYDVQSPDTSFAATVSEFEVMTAERKIFNLPTWVRFEANHHARTKVVEENRMAVAAGSALTVAGVGTEVKPNPSIKEKEWLMGPKTSQLGDVAPSSPNGSLLGGFDFDTPTPRVEAPKQQQEEEVVSVVRRLPTAAFRGRDSSSRADAKVKSSFASVFRSALHPPSRRIKPSSVDERRDGWGGILTRTSWFPSHSKGPLVSPSRKGLKKMLLQPTKEDDEWEDVLELKHSRIEQTSFLEMNKSPRWKVFRSRPVHPDPPYELNTWHTRPLPKDEVTASQLITKGTKSVENRPISTKMRWGKPRTLVLVIVTVCLVALVVNVVVVKQTGSKQSTSADGKKKVFDPLVGNIDGLKLEPATATTMGAVDPSVAKAAHMSQP